MGKHVLLLYPHQLYDVALLPRDVDQVVIVEEPLYFGSDSQYPLYMHKQKLVLHRASMRRYVEEVLWPAGYEVDYVQCQQLKDTTDIVNKVSQAARVVYFDPTDDVLSRRIETAIAELPNHPSLQKLESHNFYLSRDEVTTFFSTKKKALFSEFYLWQRERFNVLINQKTYRPVGGKLSFDTDNRKRLARDQVLPTFQVYGANEYVDEAKQYVERYFPDNPGNIDDFPWPTNRQEALNWLKEFISSRLDEFGPYEDAIHGEAPWVYHSGISPVLNIGLLNPQEVVAAVVSEYQQRDVPLASVEGFVRQVLGWREYMRGMYLDCHVGLRTANVFGHNRRLTNDWYSATTGLKPVDDVIRKVLTRGYAHHIERLMIVGNIMLLCDFHPDEVCRWFMEMFVDSYDWVMVPNVYGMSQYSDGGSMVTKPYVSSSNYILSMSHYDREEWADVWDGLYWRFIEKNKERFATNPRMKMIVSQLDRLDEGRKRIIRYRAEDFLRQKTAT